MACIVYASHLHSFGGVFLEPLRHGAQQSAYRPETFRSGRSCDTCEYCCHTIMKSETIKYYTAQLSGIFTICPLLILSYLWLGQFISILPGFCHRLVSGMLWIALAAIFARIWGWTLEKIGLLPKGAHHRYPIARSWGEYKEASIGRNVFYPAKPWWKVW